MLCTVAHKAPLYVGLSRQEYLSGLPHPSPGDLPSPGIDPTCPVSPVLKVDFLPAECLGSQFFNSNLSLQGQRESSTFPPSPC